jgi:hypothetical protein
MPLMGCVGLSQHLCCHNLKNILMKTEKIYTQHTENVAWANNAAFYRDELKVMDNRLQEIASKYTSKEVLKQVEHFQNQFIIQKERLDELNHQINLSNDSLNCEVEKNPVAIEHRKVKDHTDARNEMQGFEKSYTALKKEFNNFLSEWM